MGKEAHGPAIFKLFGKFRREHRRPQPIAIDYEQKTQELIEQTQGQFRTILASPLLPDFVRRQLLPVVDTFAIVPDEEFIRNTDHMSVLAEPVRDLAQAEGLEPPQAFGGAYYSYPPQKEQYGRVGFRQSTAIKVVRENDDLIFLGAEELSHALHPKVEVTPLTKIKNHTPLIPRGTTLDDVKTLLQKGRTKANRSIDDKDIDVIRRGFGVTFVDKQTGYEVHSVTHTIREETRAAILGTALAALYLGAQFSSAKTQHGQTPIPIEQQFLIGLRGMQMGAIENPDVLGREGAAADFIHTYLFPQVRRATEIAQKRNATIHLSVSPQEVKAGIERLFRNFGTMTYNSVYATFTKAEKEAFALASQKIGNDYLSKAVRSQQP